MIADLVYSRLLGTTCGTIADLVYSRLLGTSCGMTADLVYSRLLGTTWGIIAELVYSRLLGTTCGMTADLVYSRLLGTTCGIIANLVYSGSLATPTLLWDHIIWQESSQCVTEQCRSVRPSVTCVSSVLAFAHARSHSSETTTSHLFYNQQFGATIRLFATTRRAIPTLYGVLPTV
jgi:hypothetical protein